MEKILLENRAKNRASLALLSKATKLSQKEWRKTVTSINDLTPYLCQKPLLTQVVLSCLSLMTNFETMVDDWFR